MTYCGHGNLVGEAREGAVELAWLGLGLRLGLGLGLRLELRLRHGLGWLSLPLPVKWSRAEAPSASG